MPVEEDLGLPEEGLCLHSKGPQRACASMWRACCTCAGLAPLCGQLLSPAYGAKPQQGKKASTTTSKTKAWDRVFSRYLHLLDVPNPKPEANPPECT